MDADVRPDGELITALATGDRVAFATLYRRHAPWLVLRLAQRCGDPGMVDEVVQDTFVVERVEVPVPVDDLAEEVLQTQLAAAAAAIAAAVATQARLRRRYDRPSVSTVIDITDPGAIERPPAVAGPRYSDDVYTGSSSGPRGRIR